MDREKALQAHRNYNADDVTMRLFTVHEDSRGKIYKVPLPSGQELLLFFSKAGGLRGGHSHTVPEVVSILSGHVQYHKVITGEERTFDLHAGDTVVNYPDEPHMGFFVEDTWLIEFKFGANSAVGNWETVDFEPFRKLVRESL